MKDINPIFKILKPQLIPMVVILSILPVSFSFTEKERHVFQLRPAAEGNSLEFSCLLIREEVYGCDGIVAHYTTDVWHFTEPTGMISWGMWPMGIAWSCQHLWEHYLFNEDRQYLQEFAYPIMKEAAEFCCDWLVVNPKTKELVSGPSISPENRFITPDGHIYGLCARGGFVVDIDWKNGKLEKAKIFSKLGNECKIRYGEKVITIQTTKGGEYEFDSKL